MTMVQDVRAALRSVFRAEGYALAFILTLGLAIGVNNAVPVFHTSADQTGYGQTILAATTGEPETLPAAITSAIRRIDPMQALRAE